MRIRKNDKVRVIAGNDRGKEGKVLKVFPGSNRVIVEKVNLIKRHMRPSQTNPQGGIVEKEAAISVSNVMLVCPQTQQPTRLGIRILSDGTRVRVSKKSGEMIGE
jgi:large subunit ribosomal protein L24